MLPDVRWVLTGFMATVLLVAGGLGLAGAMRNARDIAASPLQIATGEQPAWRQASANDEPLIVETPILVSSHATSEEPPQEPQQPTPAAVEESKPPAAAGADTAESAETTGSIPPAGTTETAAESPGQQESPAAQPDVGPAPDAVADNHPAGESANPPAPVEMPRTAALGATDAAPGSRGPGTGNDRVRTQSEAEAAKAAALAKRRARLRRLRRLRETQQKEIRQLNPFIDLFGEPNKMTP